MSIERIVVRAPNWIGDVVLSLPAVRDLRWNFPAARIEVLARPWVAELYGAVAEVDAVRPSAGFRTDAASVRGAFDAAVLLPNSFAAALAAWHAGVPERWGYATDGRGLLLTRAGRIPAQVRGRSRVLLSGDAGGGRSFGLGTPDATFLSAEWASRGDALSAARDLDRLNPGAF